MLSVPMLDSRFVSVSDVVPVTFGLPPRAVLDFCSNSRPVVLQSHPPSSLSQKFCSRYWLFGIADIELSPRSGGVIKPGGSPPGERCKKTQALKARWNSQRPFRAHMLNIYRKYLGLETPGYTPPLLRSEENRLVSSSVLENWSKGATKDLGFNRKQNCRIYIAIIVSKTSGTPY